MQFPRDPSPFLILQIQQPPGELPQAMIRVIEFDSPLPNLFFHLPRRILRTFLLSLVGMPNRNDYNRCE
jgi:hypothetical protein